MIEEKTYSADDIISRLQLEAHPEGGYFKEIFRDQPADGGRGAATSIYFLLREGEVSAWHRVDAVEMWHYYAGAPLVLAISDEEGVVGENTLGTDISGDQRPFAVVPAGAWQSARSLGGWTLVGCTVAPAFSFDGFELAPPDWTPAGA